MALAGALRGLSVRRTEIHAALETEAGDDHLGHAPQLKRLVDLGLNLPFQLAEGRVFEVCAMSPAQQLLNVLAYAELACLEPLTAL